MIASKTLEFNVREFVIKLITYEPQLVKLILDMIESVKDKNYFQIGLDSGTIYYGLIVI